MGKNIYKWGIVQAMFDYSSVHNIFRSMWHAGSDCGRGFAKDCPEKSGYQFLGQETGCHPGYPCQSIPEFPVVG